jgi:hypothetical protein
VTGVAVEERAGHEHLRPWHPAGVYLPLQVQVDEWMVGTGGSDRGDAEGEEESRGGERLGMGEVVRHSVLEVLVEGLVFFCAKSP